MKRIKKFYSLKNKINNKAKLFIKLFFLIFILIKDENFSNILRRCLQKSFLERATASDLLDMFDSDFVSKIEKKTLSSPLAIASAPKPIIQAGTEKLLYTRRMSPLKKAASPKGLKEKQTCLSIDLVPGRTTKEAPVLLNIRNRLVKMPPPRYTKSARKQREAYYLQNQVLSKGRRKCLICDAKQGSDLARQNHIKDHVDCDFSTWRCQKCKKKFTRKAKYDVHPCNPKLKGNENV
jgi:transposase-like protein